MFARVLKSSGLDSEYLIQIKVGGHDMAALHPSEVMDSMRIALAEKIAACLFEKIEPKIMEILREKN